MVLNLATMVNVTEKSASVQVSVWRASEIQTNVFCDCGVQKFSRFFRAAPSFFLWQCKIAWTTWKEGSKRKELIAALRLETQSMFWLIGPGTVIGTQDNVLALASAMTLRAKKGLAGGCGQR